MACRAMISLSTNFRPSRSPGSPPAGMLHPHREQLVIGKAEGWQSRQVLQLLLKAALERGIKGTEHLGQQLTVFGYFFAIAACRRISCCSSRRFPWPCAASTMPFPWATPRLLRQREGRSGRKGPGSGG